ncbi:MAG: class I SAM-dependent methyltransferase [Methanobacterium paludis]|nr:class I SAM-dependent methyltransferase [Methanobacterium paludis]
MGGFTIKYVHGYSNKEAHRLADQADTLTGILHSDTAYSPGSKVLEAGCGVGAQTVSLAKNSPEAEITSVDISRESLDQAELLINSEGIVNVNFQQADIMKLPFQDNSFDHIFVCFVLEHLPNPEYALQNLKRVLKKGGSITVIDPLYTL